MIQCLFHDFIISSCFSIDVESIVEQFETVDDDVEAVDSEEDNRRGWKAVIVNKDSAKSWTDEVAKEI